MKNGKEDKGKELKETEEGGGSHTAAVAPSSQLPAVTAVIIQCTVYRYVIHTHTSIIIHTLVMLLSVTRKFANTELSKTT